MSIQTSEQAELERLMKRLQIGTTNYNAANNLHADCYGTIGRMAGELERLREENAALREDAERLAAIQKNRFTVDWDLEGDCEISLLRRHGPPKRIASGHDLRIALDIALKDPAVVARGKA